MLIRNQISKWWFSFLYFEIKHAESKKWNTQSEQRKKNCMQENKWYPKVTEKETHGLADDRIADLV